MTTEIVQYDSGLSDERHNQLANRFNPFAEDVRKLIETAKTVQVESVDDKAGMDLARNTRLGLKKIRVDVEKVRKELKEASLREGKAVDGMANIIKFLIVPVEESLQEKEDFVKRIEQARIDKLVAERTAELESVDVDCACFDLGAMNEAAYGALLSSSRMGYNAKVQAEAQERARIEAERVAEEQARVEREKEAEAERKRIEAENAKLRAEKAAAEKAAAESEKKRLAEKAIADKKLAAEKAAAENARKDKERAEREAKEAEAARALAAEKARQSALAAPDATKLSVLVDHICALEMPSVSSDAALSVMTETRSALNGVVKGLRDAIAKMGD